jgi:hypothetical protein
VYSSLFKSWSPGLGGATIGKALFTCVYIEKKSSPESAGKFQSNLSEEKKNIVQIKCQVLLKGEIITKMG